MKKVFTILFAVVMLSACSSTPEIDNSEGAVDTSLAPMEVTAGDTGVVFIDTVN